VLAVLDGYGKPRTHGVRFLGRAAHTMLLYQLSYPSEFYVWSNKPCLAHSGVSVVMLSSRVIYLGHFEGRVTES
jgi:hypothetical protein